MKVYRFAWGVTTTLVLSTAVVGAVAAGAGVELVVVGVGLALFCAMFVWVVAEDQPARWTWVRRSVLWAGLGAPGVDAMSTTWGTPGVALALILLMTSPSLLVPARFGYVEWMSRRSTGPLASLGQRELRRRWDATTYEVRHAATGVPRRLVLVEERRRLMEELERRDPADFEAWVVTAVPHDGPPRPRRRTR